MEDRMVVAKGQERKKWEAHVCHYKRAIPEVFVLLELFSILTVVVNTQILHVAKY